MRREFKCGCCGGLPDCPMIHDHLFLSINRGSLISLLCTNCAEERMGRRIQALDLKRVPCNEFFIKRWNELYGKET